MADRDQHEFETSYSRAGYRFSFALAEAEPKRELGERQLAHALELLRRAAQLAEAEMKERAA